VAVPPLTDEQRAAALEKAAAARRARAELKGRLKRGGTTLKQVLDDAENDEAVAKLKVSALLEALPGVGKVRAAAVMEQLEIAPRRALNYPGLWGAPGSFGAAGRGWRRPSGVCLGNRRCFSGVARVLVEGSAGGSGLQARGGRGSRPPAGGFRWRFAIRRRCGSDRWRTAVAG